MKLCLACGQGLNPQDRFCSRCGSVQAAQPSAGQFSSHSNNPLDLAADYANRAESFGRRLWPLWLALSLLATGIFIAG
ncbi:MAG TPA: hypothetical protein VJP40_08945, partial [bacterium]|nr:hypothetical protein [bacterium]